MPEIVITAVIYDGANVLFEVPAPADGVQQVQRYSLPRYRLGDEFDSIEEALAAALLADLGIQAEQQEFVETLYERMSEPPGVRINNVQLVTRWKGDPLGATAGNKQITPVPLTALPGMDLSNDLHAALLVAFGMQAGDVRAEPASEPGGRVILVVGDGPTRGGRVSECLSDACDRGALIRVEDLEKMDRGIVLQRFEAERPLSRLLALRNAAALARNFSQAGYTSVVEGLLPEQGELGEITDELGSAPVHLVRLVHPAPSAVDRDRFGQAQIPEPVAAGQVSGSLSIDVSALTAEEAALQILACLEVARSS